MQSKFIHLFLKINKINRGFDPYTSEYYKIRTLVEEVSVMLSLVRFVLWVVLIYVYFQIAEWAWTEFMSNLNGGEVLLVSIFMMVLCVAIAQYTVWKVSELFIREKHYE